MLAVMVLQTGCATAGSEPVCPALVSYSAEVQRAALVELEALPPGAVLRRMVDDYAVMRAEVRACRG